MLRQPCYRECPEGYKPVKIVDAVGDRKFAVRINLYGGLMMTAVGVLAYLMKFGAVSPLGGYFEQGEAESMLGFLWRTEAPVLALLVCLLAYMVLHELVHGISYKILTGAKLKFGVSLSCAYCGVPDVYVNKKTALISLLAPFTVFSILFVLLVIFTQGIVALGFVILFAVHLGGCSGDLYDTFLLLFRFKGEVWMNDNGPRQVFCQKADS